MVRKTLIAFAALVAATRAVAADDCSPPKLVKVVVEAQSPSIPKGHFASLPKTIYRYQSTFARIEEANDAANNIHGLIVVNEPDSWIVNLVTGDGTHAVDQKKPFVVRMPVFAGRESARSGGDFICTSPLFASKRIKLFRPDACEHSVTRVAGGSRYVLSIGWALRHRDA